MIKKKKPLELTELKSYIKIFICEIICYENQ